MIFHERLTMSAERFSRIRCTLWRYSKRSGTGPAIDPIFRVFRVFRG